MGGWRGEGGGDFMKQNIQFSSREVSILSLMNILYLIFQTVDQYLT